VSCLLNPQLVACSWLARRNAPTDSKGINKALKSMQSIRGLLDVLESNHVATFDAGGPDPVFPQGLDNVSHHTIGNG
jgi:hypothetical protein